MWINNISSTIKILNVDKQIQAENDQYQQSSVFSGLLPGELLLQWNHLRPSQLRLLRHFPETLLALQSQASLFL